MIELLIINSLIIWGVYASLQEGFIFEKAGIWIRGTTNEKDNLPRWVSKPISSCPICMASVYGTPIFWFSYFTELIIFDFIIIVYICYIFALAGLNYLILTFMPFSKEDDDV